MRWRAYALVLAFCALLPRCDLNPQTDTPGANSGNSGSGAVPVFGTGGTSSSGGAFGNGATGDMGGLFAGGRTGAAGTFTGTGGAASIPPEDAGASFPDASAIPDAGRGTDAGDGAPSDAASDAADSGTDSPAQ